MAGILAGEGTVEVPVVYDPSRPPLHIADPAHHKPAITHWQAVEHFEIQGQPVTRVKLTPVTGRSHQLRVHMQYLGHPIIGDTLYASPEHQQLSSRLCLHAERLSFIILKQSSWSNFIVRRHSRKYLFIRRELCSLLVSFMSKYIA